MFYDLNVKRPKTADELYFLLLRISKLGYDAVAVTTDLTEEFFKPVAETGKKSKQNKNDEDSVPKPFDVETHMKTERFKKLNLKIYNRVNITVYDPNVFHKISQNKRLKLYDIISYLPGSPAVLRALTSITDFDILCFDPTIDNLQLYYNRKTYNQFIQNGIYFELPYTPAILDSTLRKYVFYTSAVYHSVGKSANVIVTSAGQNVLHFRSPYDIVNLGLLLGLNEQQAKDSITRTAAECILKARTKRRGKCTIEMEISKSSEPVVKATSDSAPVSQTKESQNDVVDMDISIGSQDDTMVTIDATYC